MILCTFARPSLHTSGTWLPVSLLEISSPLQISPIGPAATVRIAKVTLYKPNLVLLQFLLL
jgi:hypothetical protein